MQIHGLSSWSDDRCVCFFLESRNEVTRGFVIFGGRSWWRQGGFEPLVLVRPIFHFLVFVAWHIVIRFSRCWRGERIWKTEMAFSFDETFFFLLLKNVHCIVHDFPIIKNTEFLPNLTVDQQNCPKRLPKSQNELLTNPMTSSLSYILTLTQEDKNDSNVFSESLKNLIFFLVCISIND